MKSEIITHEKYPLKLKEINNLTNYLSGIQLIQKHKSPFSDHIHDSAIIITIGIRGNGLRLYKQLTGEK